MVKRITLLTVLGFMFLLNPSYCQDFTIKAPDTKSLFKKITSIFDFKVRANIRRKKEIDSLLAKVNTAFAIPITDSMHQLHLLTNLAVKELIDSLSQSQNKNYADLIKTIEKISTKIYTIDSILGPNQPSINIPTNNDQLNQLAKLMTPIIAKQANEKDSQKQKNTELAKINLIMTGAAINDTTRITDTLSKIIHYTIAKNARMLAFTENGKGDKTGSYMNILDGVGYFPFGFNGTNGSLIGIKGWNNTATYSAAKKTGKEMIQTITDGSPQNLNSLLYNRNSRSVLTNELVNNNNGSICLWFKYVSEKNYFDFVEFVDSLGLELKENNANRKLYVRIAPYIKSTWLDLTLMSDMVDYYMVDFSQPATAQIAMPAAPLQGNKNENIEACMSLYMQHVAANKFILCFSYKGFVWDISQRATSFMGSIAYNAIMKNFAGRQVYDAEMASAYIDTMDQRKKTTRIWFDDEYTMGLKYDFVIEKKLGGVAIWSLGDDAGYGELYDEMTYKFTSAVADSTFFKTAATKLPLTFMQRLVIHIQLFNYMLNNPCKISFVEDNEMHLLSLTLGKTRDRLLGELKIIIIVTSLFFLLSTLILAFIYIRKTIFLGDKWKGRKIVIRGMIVSMVLFITSVFAIFFEVGTVPYFGFVQIGETPESQNCINMPFITLLLLVGIGILAGAAITKYLLFPLFKKDDIP